MRSFLPLLVLLAGLASGGAGAQSMSVIGGNSFARACYDAATVAARSGVAAAEELGDCDQAIQYADLGHRDLLATYVNRGILYMALGDLARAEADFDRAVDLEPQSGEVYVNRGNLAFARGDFGAAVQEYDRAVQTGLSRAHIAHYNRALARERLGDVELAVADYRRALELAPEWAQPQAKLDRLSRRARQP